MTVLEAMRVGAAEELLANSSSLQQCSLSGNHGESHHTLFTNRLSRKLALVSRQRQFAGFHLSDEQLEYGKWNGKGDTVSVAFCLLPQNDKCAQIRARFCKSPAAPGHALLLRAPARTRLVQLPEWDNCRGHRPLRTDGRPEAAGRLIWQ
jgi:hypothetical protein